MDSIKAWKCGVCGALIEQATGLTHVGEGSNAFKFKTLEKENLKLKDDLKKLHDINEGLAKGLKEGENSDEERDSVNVGENGSDSGDGEGVGGIIDSI